MMCNKIIIKYFYEITFIYFVITVSFLLLFFVLRNCVEHTSAEKKEKKQKCHVLLCTQVWFLVSYFDLNRMEMNTKLLYAVIMSIRQQYKKDMVHLKANRKDTQINIPIENEK